MQSWPDLACDCSRRKAAGSRLCAITVITIVVIIMIMITAMMMMVTCVSPGRVFLIAARLLTRLGAVRSLDSRSEGEFDSRPAHVQWCAVTRQCCRHHAQQCCTDIDERGAKEMEYLLHSYASHLSSINEIGDEYCQRTQQNSCTSTHVMYHCSLSCNFLQKK